MNLFRHSLAHVLAQAIQRSLDPKVQLGTGPAIENGFYYDMLFSSSLGGRCETSTLGVRMPEGQEGQLINDQWSSPTLLAKEEVLHDDIISFCHWGYSTASKEKKKARADMMKVYISKCRAMYAHSLDGLQYLNPEWRKAVRLAALLYESILDKIESNDYDVFTKSCRTNLKDKFQTLYNHNRQWK